MASMFLGINDNVKIIDYAHYSKRMYHNGRKTNLSTSNFKDKDCINLVIDNRQETKNIIDNQKKILKDLEETSLSDLSNKIARANYKIKKYEQKFEALANELSNASPNDFPKIEKKMEKKTRAIFRQKDLIKELEIIHSQKLDKRKMPKNEFNELTFNITSLPIQLMRKPHQKNTKLLEEYSKDLMKFFEDNIREIFPNMHISMLATHLDQNTPHIHLNGFYDFSHSMKQDLTQIFGKEKQFEKLQQEMHHRLQNSELVKKYNLDIKPLKNGEHYIPLNEFKLIQMHAKQATKKDVGEFIENLKKEHKTFIGMDYESIIEDLTKKLEQEHFKRLLQKKKQEATKNNISKLKQDVKNNKFQEMKRSKILKPYQDKIRELSLKLERSEKRATKSKENDRIRLNEALSKNKTLEKNIEKQIKEHEKVILEPYKEELRKQDRELEKLREVVKNNNLEHELEDSNHHRHR